jgi:hypothetical protein
VLHSNNNFIGFGGGPPLFGGCVTDIESFGRQVGLAHSNQSSLPSESFGGPYYGAAPAIAAPAQKRAAAAAAAALESDAMRSGMPG